MGQVLQNVFIDEDLFMVFLSAFDKNLSLLVPNNMQILDENDRLSMGQKIRMIYTNGEPLTDHYADGIRVGCS